MITIENKNYNLSIYLTRVVNGRTRYLKVEFLKTLFDNMFLVEKVYGSIQNSKPTGRKRNIFYSRDEAIKYFNKYIEIKIIRGYSCKNQSYSDTFS